MKFISYLFLICLLATGVCAQDAHFSQVTNFPMLLNPALQGMFKGKSRAIVAARNQNIAIPNSSFTGVYNTVGASIETSIFEELSDQNTWSLGFMGLADYAGSGSLATNQALMTSSYSLSMDRYGRSFLNIGGQVGFTSRRLFSNDLLFEAQVNEFDFDPRLPNLEPYLDGSTQFNPTANIGVAYQQHITDGSMALVGFSLYNVNAPKDFFLSTSNENIYSRLNLHGGVLFDLDETSRLYPSIIYMKQGSFSQTNIGMSYAKDLTDDLTINGAIRSRLGDAFILAAGMRYQKWNATFSYDLTTSSLSKGNKSSGAFELNLTYIWGESKAGYGNDKSYCPAF